MNQRRRVSSATELLADAARWRVASLLLSRPTAERKDEVRRLATELPHRRLAQAARAWCDNATEGAYLQLLGPGGLVPAREGAYRPFADPGLVLADIARHHVGFAFHPTTDEPPDHVAVLIDFVSYLFFKEAYARETANPEGAEVTRDVRRRFVEEHVSPVAARVAERLEACGATAWSVAARAVADEVPPPAAAVGPASSDETPVCGGCAAVEG